jgi:hypothetical protein
LEKRENAVREDVIVLYNIVVNVTNNEFLSGYSLQSFGGISQVLDTDTPADTKINKPLMDKHLEIIFHGAK